jgi:DUF1680 family protein
MAEAPFRELPTGVAAARGGSGASSEWGEAGLYRSVQALSLGSVRLRLIPYFAWANRGPSAMGVWLPVVLRG